MNDHDICLKNVRVHNLKAISLNLRRGELICFTGVSGSGKSSLAFDTIFVEGQRRYVESLSQHVRRFLEGLPKPDVDSASGITPTISIEQKTTGKNPRSMVATITEIYDYMRVLWARAAIAYCPVSKEPVRSRSKEEIIDEVLKKPPGTKLIFFAPYARNKKGEFKDDLETIAKKGFTRVRIDQTMWRVDDEILLDKATAHDLDIVIDRLEVRKDTAVRMKESLFTALEISNGSCIVADVDTKEELFLSTAAYSLKSGISYPELEPQDFSFNSPSGMCPECQGMGSVLEFRLELCLDLEKSIAEDCCSIASSYSTVRYKNIYDNLALLYDFDVHTPWKNLSEKAKKVFLRGTEKKWTRMYFIHPVTGSTWTDLVQWRGVLREAQNRYQEAKSELYKKKYEKLMKKGICPSCLGARLKPYPAAARFFEQPIANVLHMTVAEALTFFSKPEISSSENPVIIQLVKEIRERLAFLHHVGLEYLQLDRTAPTLSGGESQRVRLASQIGSGLVGATYILDEPSIGLHVRDNKKLVQALINLRDKGNTVIVVEHDEETIRSSDHIVDFGPRAGSNGGEIIFSGPYKKLLSCKESITADYLSGRKTILIPQTRRTSTHTLSIRGARHNNLKNVTAKIPLGCLVGITGVSGSGKSSLFLETLFPALSNLLMKSELSCGEFESIEGIGNIDKVIDIDQSPIGRTPRSNPATYIKLFDDIRDLYSKLPQSKTKGFKPGRFSFNIREGSCVECHGLGMLKVDMDFLEPSWIDCPLCHGSRFDQETLEVRFKGKNIRDVLDMDVKEALEHFSNIPQIEKKLQMLARVGLDYMKLGQSSTTLSGGEAQRIKLVKELTRPSTGKTLYILDEPTTGLHFHDISHLLEVLQALVNKGNTIVVIEHNLDLVKACDWIIEMGPESGDQGGNIIALGTPEDLARLDCPTGGALADIFTNKEAPRKKKAVALKESEREIYVTGACQNTLKNCEAKIPHGQITICTGPSGSGKSSFAFETVFAEGQRRYVESLSPYIRQFVNQMPKPKVERVDGLLASIAIEQRVHSANPRSTVGTMTEIYDFLRILFSRVGIPHCPKTKARIQAISKEHVVERILSYPMGEKIHVLAPIEIKRGERFEDVKNKLEKQGFLRIRLGGVFYELSDAIPFDPKRKQELFLVVDRFKVDPSIKSRIYEAISTASEIGNKKLHIAREEKDIFFNLAFAVEETGESYPEITPQTFAFNNAQGMCPECQGLGFVFGVDITSSPYFSHLTPYQCLQLISSRFSKTLFTKVCNILGCAPYSPLSEQPQEALNQFLHGSKKPLHINNIRLTWKGINVALAEAIKFGKKESPDEFFPESWQLTAKENPCGMCQGTRLNALARHVTIYEKSIADVVQMNLQETHTFLQKIHIDTKNDLSLLHVHQELVSRVHFLSEIGLGYLSLDRRSSTLSGGEAQRVRLARQMGSGLTGVLYVLDEPTAGLHPQDCQILSKALKALKNLGNTLLIVEHDPEIIKSGDTIIEFGPGSGAQGGLIVASGTLQEISQNQNSLTAQYIDGSKFLPLQKKKKTLFEESFLTIKNAKKHNLKSLFIDIPLGNFICLTGVSGSGKSSLLEDVIYESVARGIKQAKNSISSPDCEVSGIALFKNMVMFDQRPMSHTLRSDIATYMDVFTPMRHFFSELPEAKRLGLQPKHFSAYHRKGMCTTCWGLGYKKVEMHFLPPVKTECPECHGLRLNPISLSVKYQEKNLGEILKHSIEEVRVLFASHPKATKLLDALINVGLGYLYLGQEVQTLSGGESQRLKLAKGLAKRVHGKTLYLFDEPTSGLHPREVVRLVSILQDLVAKGHTVIAIEHNLDFIRCADYIIDLGPGAGSSGGTIVASGPLEKILKAKNSLTGRFLA